MAKIELNNKQLHLIQDALELYSRVGILQTDRILDHPSIDRILHDSYTPNKDIEIGSQTMRGEVTEIGEGYIKTKGRWNTKEEIRTWTDVEKIQLSPDWETYHNSKERIKILLTEINQIIKNDPSFLQNQSLGIHHEMVPECREAFDIIQVIRHEFWKANKNHSDITVDSSISLTSPDPQTKVELDTIKDIRKQKLKKINSKNG